jgi:hypothetical protein
MLVLYFSDKPVTGKDLCQPIGMPAPTNHMCVSYPYLVELEIPSDKVGSNTEKLAQHAVQTGLWGWRRRSNYTVLKLGFTGPEISARWQTAILVSWSPGQRTIEMIADQRTGKSSGPVSADY